MLGEYELQPRSRDVARFERPEHLGIEEVDGVVGQSYSTRSPICLPRITNPRLLSRSGP